MDMEVDFKTLIPKLGQRIAQLEIENALLQLALEKYSGPDVPNEGTIDPE
jgi:hypothetical protein